MSPDNQIQIPFKQLHLFYFFPSQLQKKSNNCRVLYDKGKMNRSWLSENTSEGNDANYGDFNVPIWISTTVLMTVTSVLVLVLNSLCLIVLHRTNILKEPTKVFMASLNTADLILGAVYGLPTAVLYMVGWWPFGRPLCMLYSTLGMVLFVASMMSTVATDDRPLHRDFFPSTISNYNDTDSI